MYSPPSWPGLFSRRRDTVNDSPAGGRASATHVHTEIRTAATTPCHPPSTVNPQLCASRRPVAPERAPTRPPTGRWLAVLAVAMSLAPAVSGQVDYCVIEPVMDLGIVIDSSRSISTSNYQKAIQFVFQVTSLLPISEDGIR